MPNFQLPTGVSVVQVADGTRFTGSATGRITAASKYSGELRNMGCSLIELCKRTIRISAPIASELVTVKAAAIAVNGAVTIAAQPAFPSKLNIRQVIVTAITAGTLTLVGIDPSGNAISEVVSLIAPSTQTLITTKTYAKLTSATVAGLVGGGDGTLGMGVSTALGLPVDDGYIAGTLAVYKAKVDAADEAAGTVDATEGATSIIPTTAANGARNYDFWYSFEKLS